MLIYKFAVALQLSHWSVLVPFCLPAASGFQWDKWHAVSTFTTSRHSLWPSLLFFWQCRWTLGFAVWLLCHWIFDHLSASDVCRVCLVCSPLSTLTVSDCSTFYCCFSACLLDSYPLYVRTQSDLMCRVHTVTVCLSEWKWRSIRAGQAITCFQTNFWSSCTSLSPEE